MSAKLRELQHGLEVKGSGWLRSQAGKFRVDALRALATELGVSVEGIGSADEVCGATWWHAVTAEGAWGTEGCRAARHCY